MCQLPREHAERTQGLKSTTAVLQEKQQKLIMLAGCTHQEAETRMEAATKVARAQANKIKTPALFHLQALVP